MGTVTPTTGRPRGRVPAATHDQVIQAAGRAFLAGERIDLRAIASELGLGRVSLYRWFGNREGLLEALMLDGFQREFDRAVTSSRGRGGERVLDVFDALMRAYEAAEPMHAFVAREPILARRLMTSPDGAFHRSQVAAIRLLIDEEVGNGDWHPPVDPAALAYVAVHLMADLNFSDPAHGLKGDRAALFDVLRALLGLPAGATVGD